MNALAYIVGLEATKDIEEVQVDTVSSVSSNRHLDYADPGDRMVP